MANTYPIHNATEQCVSIVNQGQTMWGMFHLPASTGPRPAVLLLHGFTASRIESHRFYVHLARALAARGIAVARFDFRGSGDSEGEFQDMTVQGELSDAKAALYWLIGQPDIDSSRVGVAGVSLGGMVAALLTGRNPNLVRGLALLAAIADPARFITGAQQRLSEQSGGQNPLEQLARDGYLMFWDYPVGTALVQTLFELNPVEELANYRGRSLIIHNTGDPVVAVENADLYAGALGERATVHKLDGASHVFSEPPVERQAIDLAAGWFSDVLR
jgi:dipeptidyl aminopeptidase/acylaminoacyl peptidase